MLICVPYLPTDDADHDLEWIDEVRGLSADIEQLAVSEDDRILISGDWNFEPTVLSGLKQRCSNRAREWEILCSKHKLCLHNPRRSTTRI